MLQQPDLSNVLPAGAGYDNGHLAIGGCRIEDLAAEFGTPTYVYDEEQLRGTLAACAGGVAGYGGPDARVVYATKAFATVAMLRLVADAGLGADVASDGELAIALAAGVDPASLVLHGNAKPRAHLERAIRAGVGLIVVDSAHELRLLEQVAAETGRCQSILVRVTPGIDADTHEFIRTGHDECKFGVSMDEGEELLGAAMRSDHLQARGIHLHVGSQLLDGATWSEAVDWAVGYVGRLLRQGIPVQTVDFGGGLGIPYLPEQEPRPVEAWLRSVCTEIEERFAGVGLPLPELIFEPGRAIAGPAGVTVYTAVTTKRAGDRHVVAVDGGMSDNPRPMLYGARYVCVPAREPAPGTPTHTWIVAGFHCESGDLLVDGVELADPHPGDLLVIPATGAYGHAMSSNYNAALRPAVVFVAGGDARLVVRRETIDDLLARELS